MSCSPCTWSIRVNAGESQGLGDQYLEYIMRQKRLGNNLFIHLLKLSQRNITDSLTSSQCPGVRLRRLKSSRMESLSQLPLHHRPDCNMEIRTIINIHQHKKGTNKRLSFSPGRNGKCPSLSDTHAKQPLVPPSDHLTHPEGELERLVPATSKFPLRSL